jgi:hypothetical protein
MKRIGVIFIFFFTFSCTTYYQKNLKFNQFFQAGKLDEAYQLISKDTKKHRKDKLLVLLNRGMVTSMLGKYTESNLAFEEAYRYVDDLQKNYVNEGLALLTNPNMVPYKGEGYELLYIHYFKAFNFLRLNDKEAALVECKRMDIVLNQLESKWKSDNKFKRDAFIHLLMGLIYDVNGDYNNAFIAYRNSYEIYSDDYQKLFGFGAPLQLKQDLLRTSYQLGFMDLLSKYEKEFNLTYTPKPKSDGELIYLWHNGLGPIKSEWSIDFVVSRGMGGNVFFVNNQLGLSYSFAMSDNEYRSSGLSDLSIIRIAFPKFVDREPVFKRGSLVVNGHNVNLEKVEDVNLIAHKSLKDRMHIELSKSLLRFALKKATELRIKKENQSLGAAVGVFNALSEKADTRYWSTLPNSIYYGRVPLNSGSNEVKLRTQSADGSYREFLNKYEIRTGQVIFETFNSLESRPPKMY